MKLFLILSLLLSSSIGAQNSTAPSKFDEFFTNKAPRYFFDEEVTFETRLGRFITRLRREPAGKVYLVYYRAKVARWNPYASSERRAEQAKNEITHKTRFYADDIDLIDGGVKDEDMVEFWIGRKNSLPPELTPKYPESVAVVCPEILLNAQKNHLNDREPAGFSAQLHPDKDIGFQWTVSAGKILNGQGTRSIDVDVRGVKKLLVSVTSTVLPDACSHEQSASSKLARAQS